MANPFEVFGTLAFILPVAIYLLMSYVLYKIGQKFDLGSPFWHYLVPIYNMVLMCRCGDVSAWNVLGMMIFPINIYSIINVWGSIAERLGKSYWLYGITTLLFGIPVFILAFDSSTPAGKTVYTAEPAASTDEPAGDSFKETTGPVDPSIAFASQSAGSSDNRDARTGDRKPPSIMMKKRRRWLSAIQSKRNTRRREVFSIRSSSRVCSAVL